jgi:hypothetical protein
MRSTISGIQIPTAARLNIDGEFTLDSVAGTSGQVLTSAGAGATPTWANPSGGYISTFNTDWAEPLYYDNRIHFSQSGLPTAIPIIRIPWGYGGAGKLAYEAFSSNSTVRGYIKIKSLIRDYEVVWQVNNTGIFYDEQTEYHAELYVTYKQTFGQNPATATFNNNEPIAMEFYRTGDKGTTGNTGATGKSGYAATFTSNLYASDAINNTGGTTTATYTGFQINNTIATSAGITLLQSSTSTIKGHFRIRSQTGSPDALYAVTDVQYYPPDDSPDSWVISITYVSSTAPSSAFTNGQAVLIEFYRTGDAGTAASLPVATATVLGGIELFDNTVQTTAANAVTTTASKTYGLQLNSSGQAVVNVPWADTNTFPDTWTWTAGSTSGPTAAITGTSSTISVFAIPSASSTASGIITTGTQTIAGTKTLTGSLVGATTSTSLTPIRLPSGTVPTTANQQFGMIGADAESLQLATTKTTGAGPGFGFIRAPQMVYAVANSGAATTSTPVSPFATTNDVLSSLEVGKSYRFRGTYYLTSTFTSGTPAIQLVFAFNNAPVIFKYNYKTYKSSGQAAFDLVGQSSTNGASTVSASVTTTGSYVVEFEGFFTSNATTASTFTPQFQMSVTGVSTVATAGSFLEIEKLGTSTQTLIAGNWA